MSLARSRFLVLFAVAVAIPLIVWWPDIQSVLDGDDGDPPLPWEAIAMGEAGGAFTLMDPTETEVRVSMRDGARPTVVWFWSAMCPCIPDCEERIQTLIKDFPDGKVRFFAVDPNPHDTREYIEKIRTELKSPYPVYRDISARIVYRLGVTASASVAVFDAEGRLAFRGAIDDDIYEPTVSYVHRALEGLLAGEAFEPQEVAPYGCTYPPLEE
ncbi:MAG: redoxin domain-containing protein [Planctomycetota bacterium]|nr:redoxin domain-containing protein [Planctomycetota bacterium]